MAQLEQDYELIGQIIALMIIRNNEKSPNTGKLCHHGANMMFSVPLANQEYKSKFGVDMFEDYFKQENPKDKVRSIKTSALLANDVDPKYTDGYHSFVSKLYISSLKDHLVDLVGKPDTTRLDLLDRNMMRAVDLSCLKHGHILTWGWFKSGDEINEMGSMDIDFWKLTEDMDEDEYNKFFKETHERLNSIRKLMRRY